jgi:hypothetical protein
MSDAKRCDRCKKRLALPVEITLCPASSEGVKFTIDLCQLCRKRLRIWLGLTEPPVADQDKGQADG